MKIFKYVYLLIKGDKMTVAKELLEIMACPKCKGEIRYEKKENKIVCDRCRLKFPVLEGDIPDMLIEDAEKF